MYTDIPIQLHGWQLENRVGETVIIFNFRL